MLIVYLPAPFPRFFLKFSSTLCYILEPIFRSRTFIVLLRTSDVLSWVLPPTRVFAWTPVHRHIAITTFMVSTLDGLASQLQTRVILLQHVLLWAAYTISLASAVYLLIRSRSSRSGSTILLVGPSDGGKTAIFSSVSSHPSFPLNPLLDKSWYHWRFSELTQQRTLFVKTNQLVGVVCTLGGTQFEWIFRSDNTSY